MWSQGKNEFAFSSQPPVACFPQGYISIIKHCEHVINDQMLRAFIAKIRSGRISEDTRPDRLGLLLSPILLTDRRVFQPASLYAWVRDLCRDYSMASWIGMSLLAAAVRKTNRKP